MKLLNRYDLIISCDCGYNGGCVICDTKTKKITSIKNPHDMNMFHQYFIDWTKYGNVLLVIEHQQLRETDFRGGKWHVIQTLVINYHILLGIARFYKVDIIDVFPVSWQSFLKLKIQKKETDTERKNRYKDFALSIFPGHQIALWNSDAYILLYYALQRYETDFSFINQRIKSYPYLNELEKGGLFHV